MIGRPTVLFVCVHNAGRSQMAAGWLTHLAGDAVESTGTSLIPLGNRSRSFDGCGMTFAIECAHSPNS